MKDRQMEYAVDDSCLDPVLGAELWRLAADDCPAELRARLQVHLRYCASCRLQQAVEQRVAAGLRSGDLVLRHPRPQRAPAWSAGIGMTAVACGLAVVLLATPRPDGDGLVMRGGEGPAIERPVPDEIVLGGRPDLRWTPVPGATRYEVEIRSADGSWRGEASTTEASLEPGGDISELEVGRRYRLTVRTIPVHLAPDGGLTTSFSTGAVPEWLRYRIGHGPLAGRVLGGAGLIGLLGGLVGFAAARIGRRE